MHTRIGVFPGQRIEIYSLRVFALRGYNNKTSITKSFTTLKTISASHFPNEY